MQTTPKTARFASSPGWGGAAHWLQIAKVCHTRRWPRPGPGPCCARAGRGCWGHHHPAQGSRWGWQFEQVLWHPNLLRPHQLPSIPDCAAKTRAALAPVLKNVQVLFESQLPARPHQLFLAGLEWRVSLGYIYISAITNIIQTIALQIRFNPRVARGTSA